MERSESSTASAKRQLYRLGMAASLVFNLFLAAIVVGYVARTKFASDTTMPALAAVLAQAGKVLSPADKLAFGAIMKRNASQYEGPARKLILARQEVERQIAAEPYDKDAVRRSLNEWRTRGRVFFDAFSESLIDGLAEVSPEGRRKILASRPPQRLPQVPSDR